MAVAVQVAHQLSESPHRRRSLFYVIDRVVYGVLADLDRRVHLDIDLVYSVRVHENATKEQTCDQDEPDPQHQPGAQSHLGDQNPLRMTVTSLYRHASVTGRVCAGRIPGNPGNSSPCSGLRGQSRLDSRGNLNGN